MLLLYGLNLFDEQGKLLRAAMILQYCFYCLVIRLQYKSKRPALGTLSGTGFQTNSNIALYQPTTMRLTVFWSNKNP
ncbi:hypothetical protein EV677_0396 [Herminiimonas fonticola]|uniref:Uncharacterized protein n=1 Tax=Herminiimonas fonticola TaxID=303380 RepID=A0A4R6GG25_9BURK|nr:hypothetical protein Hfont_0380 [Herminiimonas fonticola]TDN93861.1 hypothetical protein EV677_0396 [Herminiimonas fonticola]